MSVYSSISAPCPNKERRALTCMLRNVAVLLAGAVHCKLANRAQRQAIKKHAPSSQSISGKRICMHAHACILLAQACILLAQAYTSMHKHTQACTCMHLACTSMHVHAHACNSKMHACEGHVHANACKCMVMKMYGAQMPVGCNSSIRMHACAQGSSL